jgi:hypothetical protein
MTVLFVTFGDNRCSYQILSLAAVSQGTGRMIRISRIWGEGDKVNTDGDFAAMPETVERMARPPAVSSVARPDTLTHLVILI